MVEVDPERFEVMVSEALDGIPAELGELMSNVAVTDRSPARRQAGRTHQLDQTGWRPVDTGGFARTRIRRDSTDRVRAVANLGIAFRR